MSEVFLHFYLFYPYPTRQLQIFLRHFDCFSDHLYLETVESPNFRHFFELRPPTPSSADRCLKFFYFLYLYFTVYRIPIIVCEREEREREREREHVEIDNSMFRILHSQKLAQTAAICWWVLQFY